MGLRYSHRLFKFVSPDKALTLLMELSPTFKLVRLESLPRGEISMARFPSRLNWTRFVRRSNGDRSVMEFQERSRLIRFVAQSKPARLETLRLEADREVSPA